MSPSSISQTPTSDLKTLSTLLTRLSSTILSSDPQNPLRSSPYLRQKTSTNLEYARSLLLTLEHQAATTKTSQARKNALQEELLKKRVIVKKLSDRIWEMGSLDLLADGEVVNDDEGQEEEEEREEEEEEEDKWMKSVLEDEEEEEEDNSPNHPPIIARKDKPQSDYKSSTSSPSASPRTPKDLDAPLSPHSMQKSTLLSSTLRSRRKQQQQQSPISPTRAKTTAAATAFSTGRDSHAQTSPPRQKLESTDSLHNEITSSLVHLAQQLKASAQSFRDELESDKSQLGRTEDALGKNRDGLTSATVKMGVLRRMSEGRWWWGRMVLYAGIGVLWVVLIVLVFAGPKLRF